MNAALLDLDACLCGCTRYYHGSRLIGFHEDSLDPSNCRNCKCKQFHLDTHIYPIGMAVTS